MSLDSVMVEHERRADRLMRGDRILLNEREYWVWCDEETNGGRRLALHPIYTPDNDSTVFEQLGDDDLVTGPHDIAHLCTRLSSACSMTPSV